MSAAASVVGVSKRSRRCHRQTSVVFCFLFLFSATPFKFPLVLNSGLFLLLIPSLTHFSSHIMPDPTWTSPFGSSAPPSGAFHFEPTWPSPDVASSLPQWPDAHGNGGYVGQTQEPTTPSDSYDQLSYYSPSTVATSSADTSSNHLFTSVALAPASQSYVSTDFHASAQPSGNNIPRPVTSTQGNGSKKVASPALGHLTGTVFTLFSI